VIFLPFGICLIQYSIKERFLLGGRTLPSLN
jgi:hypothetical protein